MLKRLFFCLWFVMALGLFSGYAQAPTTQGTEFWVSFMKNGFRKESSENNHLTLIASAKEGCDVRWYNPQTGASYTYTVSSQGVCSFEIPDEHCYNDQVDGQAFKGVQVTATKPISLYIANETKDSYDAANVLPISALGCKYMVQSNQSIGEATSSLGMNRASFLVIATQDYTHVRITPTCETQNHPAGIPYEITLYEGECYHVINKNVGSLDDSEGDFTGTLIESLDNKPIAVFNGNCLTSVSETYTTGYDHVFEQAMPVDDWGKRFVITSSYPYATLQEDLVKVTALLDDTQIQIDDEEPVSLQSGESHAFWMDLRGRPCAYLESNNPVAVYLYNHSHGSGGGGTYYGDPSMVWISPVEQTIEEITFSTFEAEGVENHYVNIVYYTDSLLYLDGASVDPNHVHEVPAEPSFSYVRQNIAPGVHTISCKGGVVAHVYGIGRNEGYAYSVGSSAKTLTKQLFVNDILSSELPEGYSVCQNDAHINFRMVFNYEYEKLVWDFGDDSPTEEDITEVSHEYAFANDYEVKCKLYHKNEILPFDSLSVMIHVSEVVNVYKTDTACVEYAWFDRILTDSGIYDTTVYNPDGCDSIYHLALTVGNPPERPEREVQSCDVFHWYDTICAETRDYIYHFATPEGCEYDSILHFTLLPVGDITYVVDTCDRYVWLGKVYDEIGRHEYDTTIVGDNGCESHLTLDLTLQTSMAFAEIVGLDYVAVATSFWPGQYDYYVDSTGMDVSRITWELLDNPEGPGQWEFRPHGASCTIVAYSRGQKELKVSSGDGLCDGEASLIINCTGYGVDEADVLNVEIYPNPTKGELMVKGIEMEKVVIYSLVGQKLKSTAALGAEEIRMDVRDLPQALYLLEVQTRRGNKTRLISVIK